MDGLIREVKEESGIDVEISHFVSIYSNTGTYEGHSGVKTVPTKVAFGMDEEGPPATEINGPIPYMRLSKLWWRKYR